MIQLLHVFARQRDRAAIANIYKVDPLPCVNTKFRLHYLFIEPYARTFPCTNRSIALFARTLPSIPSPDQRLQRAPTCIGYGAVGGAGLGDAEVSFQCLVSFSCPINSNTWWPVASAGRPVLRSESLGFSGQNFRRLNYPGPARPEVKPLWPPR